MRKVAIVLALLFCFHLFHHRGHKSACACGGAVGVAAVGYGGCGVAYAQPVAVAFAAPVYAAPVFAQPVLVATPYASVGYGAAGFGVVGVDNGRTTFRQRTVIRHR